MKIFEITDKFKVMQSSPQGIKLASQNGTEITLPDASALQPNPTNPKSAMLDFNKLAPGQQGQQGQQPAPGQQPTDQQPAPGQQGQQPAPGQQGQQPAPVQLPQVGSEVELPDNIGSTMQSETFNDKDLIGSGENTDINGDKTDDFIDDIVDHKWEKNAGRSNRNVIQPEPMRESSELIDMLTIAGLR